MSVAFVAASRLPTRHGTFMIHAFEDPETGKEHVALVMGDVTDGEPVLMRVHSECLTGDVMGSLRCDCRDQLEAALKKARIENDLLKKAIQFNLERRPTSSRS